MSSAPPLPEPGAGALGFALTVLEGRAALTLAPRPMPGGRLEALTLEIPGLRFPFDVSGGSRRFQHRRCVLEELALSLEGPELSALLARVPFADFGLHEPTLELHADGICFVARATVAGAEAPLVAYARLEALEGGRVRLAFDDVRVYGLLSVPAPLLLYGAFAALGASEAGGPLRTVGAGVLEVAGVELALEELLVAHGWRLPARERVEVSALALQAGRLELRFTRMPEPAVVAVPPGGALPAMRTPALAPPTNLETRAEPEAALAAGELRAALESYRRLAAGEARPGVAVARWLQVMGASPLPAAVAELGEAARVVAAVDPGSPAALVALAQVARRGGRADEAALVYTRLAERAAARGGAIDEAAAWLAAADAHRDAGHDEAALAAIERALQRRSADPAAWRRLVDLLTGAGQAAALAARLEAAAPGDDHVRASLRARAGLVRLTELQDRAGAAALIAEALALDPECAAAWQGRAALADRADRTGRAAALERAAALYARAGQPREEAAMEVALVELAVEAEGDLAGSAPVVERALDRLRRATDLDPAGTDALGELAALCLRLGRPSEAYHALDRALRRARRPAQRVALLRRLASAEYQHRRDPLAAGRLLARALEEGPAHAGVLDDLFALRSEQGSLGDMKDLLARALAVAATDDERREVDRLLAAMAAALGPSVGALVRARAAWTRGELGAAARHFDEVLTDEGEGATTAAAAEANLRLAQWARVAGQMSNANRHLARALEIEPEGRAPVDVLVEVMEAFGRADDLLALLDVRRAEPRDPTEGQQAARAAAQLLERRGRADEAEALYRQVLARDADDLPALGGLAELYRREARPLDLAPMLERLLVRALEAERDGDPIPVDVVDPEAVAVELAALMVETLEQPAAGERILRQVLAVRPRSEDVKRALSALLARVST